MRKSFERTTCLNPNYERIAYSRPSSFADFYPFYLGEHQNTVNRRLHLFATSTSVGISIYALAFAEYQLISIALVHGYALAWVGHFFFENNKPATFKHPIWSLAGDIRMWFEVVTLQRNG